LLAGAALIFSATQHPGSSPTGTPTAASLAPEVDGIKCQAGEMLAYHIHQHLALYDHGKLVPIPSSIGIPGGELSASCFYWIHVHATYPDIIHVESPSPKIYHLGNFFDLWEATKSTANPSGDTYVRKVENAAASGQLTVYVGRKPWHGSYRNIPLTSHESITLEIGKPIVPPQVFTNWSGL
jgi:hypothetical protein